MTGDQRFASKRADVVSFQTDPLTEDVTIVGPIAPTLHVATSGTDADFDVKLIDVFPADAPNWPGDNGKAKHIDVKIVINNAVTTVQIKDDGEGFDIETEVKTEVYAKQKSVKYTQKYLAMQAGQNPEIVLEVRMEDWELTKHIVNSMPEYAIKAEIDSAVYNIIGNYSPDGSKVLLTLGW
jgi:hypothetical protein